MKRMFAALLAILMLTSCTSGDGSGKDNVTSSYSTATISTTSTATDTSVPDPITDPDTSVEEDIYTKNFPTAAKLKEKYPDKTVLVWTIEETGYERNYPFRTAEVNEYLDSLGLDYRVCFYPIRAMQKEDMSDLYTSYVTEMIERGEQVDIVYSSFTALTEAGNNAYHKYIYNGIFEPLDKYFETEAGKKLYDIMPKEHWQAMTVNGNIYGVDGAMHTLSDDHGYYVNTELAEKYGFDTKKPIEEQTDVLDKIAENEDCDVIASYDDYGTASYFVDIKEITSAVYFDENEQAAKCVLDDPEYIEKLRFFYDMNKKGYVVDPDAPKSKTFFILRTNFPGGNEHFKKIETTDITYNGNKVSAIPVFTGTSSVKSCGMATGISSSSEYKDKAFELLALTQTDPYLNNLLTYGKEGEDHQLSDGCADEVINPVSLDRFANKMICYRTKGNTISPEEYTTIYKNAEVSGSLGFAFDGRELIPQTSATSMLLQSFDFMSADDLDTEIAELRAQLEEKGLNEIIDACNKQYKEYRS